MSDPELTHVNSSGDIKMIDVSEKPDTDRLAVAKGEVIMSQRTFTLIEEGALKKGNVLITAQIAGILGAKKTSELIPLCHPIIINQIDVKCILNPELPGVVINASVRTFGKTGAEMEALTAVTIAGLTIYDMVKAVEKTVKLQNIRLIEKHGGNSGDIQNG